MAISCALGSCASATATRVALKSPAVNGFAGGYALRYKGCRTEKDPVGVAPEGLELLLDDTMD